MRRTGRWNPGACHQLFRKPLGGLDSRCFACWPEDRQSSRLKEIDDPGFERALWSDDREIDPLVLRECRQLLELPGANQHAARDGSDSRIAGCGEELGVWIVAAQLPGERMLAPATAD